MRKQGFTLIELLAVIVILAIIALISVPLILGVIDSVQKASYKESLRSIFTATDLYVAGNEFIDFPEEGIDVTDARIQLKNKNFISGTIFKNEQGQLELDMVSNDKYCGSGTINNLIIIEGRCDSLDTTPPTITIVPNLITSSSVTIAANAEDLDSGINRYQFSMDGGVTWTPAQSSEVYTFSGLISNTEYTFLARAYNNNELSTISESLVISTNDIPIPTYSINPIGWTQSAVVTISYPNREDGYIYQYSLDEGITWEEVTSPATTKDITFTANGSVIARIFDGTNEVMGTTYGVTNIDTTAPIITVNPATVNVFVGGTYNDSGVSANDNASGNLTASIVTTGSVNTSSVGTYTLNYSVTDEAGNVATATRTVNVVSTTVASISTGQLNNRSMGLYNNQYYIYWPSGSSIGYLILNSQLQTVSSGSFSINGSTYDAGSVTISTNTGTIIWSARRDNHYYGTHLSAGTYFGWHNAGYMDIANLSGYTILFHTGRTSGGNYARVFNFNKNTELSFAWSDAGWGESWRVFPYSSNTALALGGAAGKLKITVDTSGNMTYQQNPSEIPSDISSSYSMANRIQLDENKKFHYMTNGNTYKNHLGSITLNVEAGTINDYALNIHPNYAVTATLINNNKLNYRIINRTNNQIIVSQTYTLSGTYNYLTPIQSIGNSTESVFVIRNSSNVGVLVFKVPLPTP